MRHPVQILLLTIIYVLGASARSETGNDPRSWHAGKPIHVNGYADQPYVVVLSDGAWLCVFTTGSGHEGAPGQHVVATRSSDQGGTWTKPVPLEPSSGPPASWGMPFLTDYGRVYVFYNYNGDRVRTLPGSKKPVRDDMMGWYCYRYSDDGGVTWSDRYRLPVRTTACDRSNQWDGEVQVLWGIGKPQNLSDGSMIFGFTKLGRYMLDDGEGWFFRCPNIHMERDPSKLIWQNLPGGEHGLRHPGFGSVQEEHNLVELSNGTLYCVYRTTGGFIAVSTSEDTGQTWAPPEKLRYATGEVIPNPRACPRLFKCGNGRFLLWFENHHGRDFDHRNPAWLSGGVEDDEGRIRWSQPAIAVYSDDTSYGTGRFSYPDLVEQTGRYWLTCTNKVEARAFQLAPELLQRLWSEVDSSLLTQTVAPDFTWEPDGAATSVDLTTWDVGSPTQGVWLDPARRDHSLTMELEIELQTLRGQQSILEARTENGAGLQIQALPNGCVALDIVVGDDSLVWRTDEDMLQPDVLHTIRIVFDNGPGIVLGYVDGKLCDGDTQRPFGWHRYRDLHAVENHRLPDDRPPPRSLGPIPLNKQRQAVVNTTVLHRFSLWNKAR